MPKMTTDIRTKPHPSILIVGDSGTHKTFFGGTAPKPYFFDFDGGMAVLRHIPGVAFDTYKDAPYGKTVTDQMKEAGFCPWGTAWETFIGRLDKIGQTMDAGTCPFETLVLDSLTTLSDICMNYVLKYDNKAPGQIAIQNWGSQIQLLQKVMDELTAWPINLIVTSHIQRNQNDLTQVVEMLPLVTGKLAGKVGLYFDEVYYAKVKIVDGKPVFYLTTSSSGMEKQAKSRYGVPNDTPTNWKEVAKYFSPPPPPVAIAG